MVPLGTVLAYRDALQAQGIGVQTVVDGEAGHGWLRVAPSAITAFFEAH